MITPQRGRSSGRPVILGVLWPYLALLLTAGCYSYAPMAQGEVRPGRDLRARLTDDGTDWIETQIGEEQPAVAGSVVRASADTLVLAVWRSDLPNQVRFQAAHDTLRLPNEYVAMVEEKRLSYLKTGALIGAAAVGLYFLIDNLGGDRSGAPGNPGGPMLFRTSISLP